MSEPKLIQISGIGPATAEVLKSNGFVSVAVISRAREADLTKVPGFGPARAATIIAAARTLLSSAESPKPTPTVPKADKKKKKKKKRKKDKKGKGKDRKKKGKKKNGKGKKKKKKK